MRKFIVAAIVAITIAMSLGYGITTRPILADDQLYTFLAERCASGVPPHVSQLEVKTQLPTLIGGAAIAAGRLVGVNDVLAERITTTAFAGICAMLACILVLELTASEGAALVAAAATFSIYGLYMEAATGFQPKVFMVAFALAAHLAAARRRAVTTGIAGMCAFLCWQPAGLVLASCGLAMLLDRRAVWKQVAIMVGAALATLTLYEAWFWWQGALGEQIRQEFLLAFGSEHKPFDAVESFWFVLTEAQTYRSRPDGLPSVFFAATALLWLGMTVRPKRAWAAMRDCPGLVSVWSAAHVAVAFTLFDHQAHPDMLLVQPYFAVACGIAAAWVGSALRRLRGGTTMAVAAMTTFVVLGLRDAYDDVARAVGGRDGLEQQLEMARLANLYADHRGSMWVIGSVHLLAFEHRDNWVPVGNVGRETADLDMKTYRPLRDGVMPEIIVAGRGLRPGFGSWLPREYVDITPLLFANARIRVFSRRSNDHPGFENGTAPTPARGPQPSPRPPQAGRVPSSPAGNPSSKQGARPKGSAPATR